MIVKGQTIRIRSGPRPLRPAAAFGQVTTMSKWMTSLWQSLVNGPRSVEGTSSLVCERRQTPRYPSELEMTCYPAVATDASPVTVRMRDISAGGIGLLSSRRFEPGTLLEVEWPGRVGKPPLRMVSCVRHVRPVASNGWALGCSFIRELDDPELGRFHELF